MTNESRRTIDLNLYCCYSVSKLPNRFIYLQLKYVSKLKAHFVKMVNIFRNFYGIRDFTFAMHSYDNKDNFPLWLIKNPSYLQLKKEDEKFPGFRRGSLVPEKSIYGESPAFAVSENVLGFITRARWRPQIAPNDRQLT